MTVELTYESYGDLGNPAVILIHPFPFRAQFWSAIAPQIAQAGYYVLAPNLRGCASSPIGDDEPSMELLAHDVWSLADSLGLKNPIVMGVSLGGYVTLAMLRARPRDVVGIGLIDTKATADSPAAIRNRMRIAQEVRDTLTPSEYAELMLPTLLSEFTHQHRPEVVDQVRQWISASSELAIAWLQEAMASRPDSSQLLSEFSGPVLLIRGTDDVVSKPEDFAHMHDLAREAKFIEVPDCGHLPPVEDSDRTEKIIESWLKSLTL